MLRNQLIPQSVILLLVVFISFPEAGGQSIYTEAVNIPEYSPLNREHFIISSIADWSHINDSDKRFFYVEPSLDYGTITIYASGTMTEKRYLSLLNGNNDHPAKLALTEQANVSLVFDDAHYWIVDRMSSINSNEEACYIIKNRSTNIVLNRLNLSGFSDGFNIKGPSAPPFTENITVQNSRFDRMSFAGIDRDRVAILLGGEIWNHDRTLLNTKILNNEIKNCNDGIMLIRHPSEGHQVNYSGTIIDNNHIYVDQEVYTDGNGNHDPNGIWALTEDGIDLKGGSEDPEHPVIISNNYFWGFRKTDQNGGGSGGAGSAITGHYYVKNLIIKNNVIFNSNRGITFADVAGMAYSVENAEIFENILYDIGYDTNGKVEYANFCYHSNNVRFYKNTIATIDKKSRWFTVYGSEQNMDISCNVIIDSYGQTGLRSLSTIIANNTFYSTDPQHFKDGKYYSNSSSAKMENLTFTTDLLSNNPRKITLDGVLTTESSPHADGCFSGPVADIDLHQNYPNPFHEYTTIQYFIPEATYVRLGAYNIKGIKVATLVSQQQLEGDYQVTWEPSSCPAGIYYCRLSSENSWKVRRMIVTR